MNKKRRLAPRPPYFIMLYAVYFFDALMADCAAASLAMGTLKGEQLT